MSHRGDTLLLTGGVGGARLCDGFAQELPGERLKIVANTGDDFEHLGMYISPDLDSVIYALAGLADPERGWGFRDESWRVMESIARLGGETWFTLGDQDMATHILRTAHLREGGSLTSFTAAIARRLGIKATIYPMTEAPVRTMVESAIGSLSFQDYFVRHRCEPAVKKISFSGAAAAQPPRSLLDQLIDGAFSNVVICPSNPFVSIGPILSLPGFKEALKASGATVTAIAPIIAGRAVKGPAAKMLKELGYEVSALGVAEYYSDIAPGLIGSFVVDQQDQCLAIRIRGLGMQCRHADILIASQVNRRRLARWLMDIAGSA